MGNLSRKLSRKKAILPAPKPPQAHGVWLSQKDVQKLKEDVTESIAMDAMTKVLAAAAYVLKERFGALQRKETRLQNFAELFRECLETIDNPTEAMKAAEDELERTTGVRILRNEKK